MVGKGPDSAARAAIQRLLTETGGPVQRCRLLPAAVEVLVACGDVERAREAAEELSSLASAFCSLCLEAMAAHASGTVELAAGDAAGALPYLRKAGKLWTCAESPYERARAQATMGRALAAVGDLGSARRELEASRWTFRRLGARPAADEVSRLLTCPADMGLDAERSGANGARCCVGRHGRALVTVRRATKRRSRSARGGP